MYKDYVIWAFSYIDNRDSFNIVVYDCQGNIVKQMEKKGARYVWQITSNSEKRTITVWGQSNKTIEMSWDDLDF